jgi:hypothetical protein
MLSATMASAVAVSIVLIWSASAAPSPASPVRSGHWAGSHSRDRISDLPQWKKTSRAVTSRTARAGLPCTENRLQSSALVSSRAVPLTRSEYGWPGTRKSSPSLGFAMRLWKLSTRLFPGRSGIRRVWGFSTATKPGASPRGEASGQPPASAVETTRNGDHPMKARACTSIWSRLFFTAKTLGAP